MKSILRLLLLSFLSSTFLNAQEALFYDNTQNVKEVFHLNPIKELRHSSSRTKLKQFFIKNKKKIIHCAVGAVTIATGAGCLYWFLTNSNHNQKIRQLYEDEIKKHNDVAQAINVLAKRYPKTTLQSLSDVLASKSNTLPPLPPSSPPPPPPLPPEMVHLPTKKRRNRQQPVQDQQSLSIKDIKNQSNNLKPAPPRAVPVLPVTPAQLQADALSPLSYNDPRMGEAQNHVAQNQSIEQQTFNTIKQVMITRAQSFNDDRDDENNEWDD